MEVNAEFFITIATIVLGGIGLLWRFETRISGVETRLGERISGLSDRVSRVEENLDSFTEVFATKADIARIEGLLEGYFMQSGKKEDV